MNTWQEIGVGAGVAAVLAGGTWFVVWEINKGVVTVQTAPAVRQDLTSIVTASGEVKPAHLYQRAGRRDRQNHGNRGEGRRPRQKRRRSAAPGKRAAHGRCQRAARRDCRRPIAGVKSAEANDVSAQADIKSRAADLETRKTRLGARPTPVQGWADPKQDYDTGKATYDGAVAALASAQARADQARAQLDQARSGLSQNQAMLNRLSDVLRKTTYTAPINGVVTYIAVRVGENVVPGIQNATGSYLMTISDMSVVTSEVMVDETDIVSVKLGEDADVTIDALPGKLFKGKVTEVGTQAVLRSSGLASTQSTTGNQEAKDFKVVVTVQNPPDGLRPGLSSTSKITTEQKKNVMTIPHSGPRERTKKDLDEAAKGEERCKQLGDAGCWPPGAGPRLTAAASSTSKNPEIQGVFVVRNKTRCSCRSRPELSASPTSRF